MVTIIRSILLMKNSEIERLNTSLVRSGNTASKCQNLDLNRGSLVPEPVFLILTLPFNVV